MNAWKNLPDLRKFYLLALLCFVPTLFHFYVGEEGVFTLNSLEMWQRHEFRDTIMYGFVGGGGNGRPPLYNWLIIPLAQLIGWKYVLVAARIVAVGATIATSLTIGWLAHQLWRNSNIAWMAALLHLLSADVLLYHGWLAYADPLFALFVVQAIAFVWVACLHRSYWMLAAAMLAAFAALLTKALTVYVFLGISMLVLMREPQHRHFLLRSRAWLIYALSALLPLLWFKFGSHDTTHNGKLIQDILEKLAIPDKGAYLLRLAAAYPLEMLARMAPASFFVGYLLLRKREAITGGDAAMRTALLIVLLNFLPYWLAPQGGARYVLPIYPFLALAAAWLVTQHTETFRLRRWLTGMLVAGAVMHLLAFPLYQRLVRGETYVRMADEIIAQYGQYPIYATNTSSVGLSVVANIDSRNLDRPPINLPPTDFSNGIVIAYAVDDIPAQFLRELRGNQESIVLLCRGAACSADNRTTSVSDK